MHIGEHRELKILPVSTQPFQSILLRMQPRLKTSLSWQVIATLILAAIGCSVFPRSMQAQAGEDATLPPALQDRSPMTIEGLGKGAVPIEGLWQFHLGDDPAWASPDLDDRTGHNGWEQITAERSWGLQTHPKYTGYAWYRRAFSITTAPGASPEIALLIPGIDEAYELYWNGVLIGHLGSFSPHLTSYAFVAPQTYGLGPVRSGVLAVRVYKLPLASVDDGTVGGFQSAPLIGSPEAIAAAKGDLDFQWLRRQQFSYGLASLYGLVALLSLMAWVRDRKQWLLFWMAIYAACLVMDVAFNNLRLPIPLSIFTFVQQFVIEVRETSQWFLLLWLLQLHDRPRLVRLTRFAAIVSLAAGGLDGLLLFLIPDKISARTFQIADAIFTFFVLVFEAFPVLLVFKAFSSHKRLDSSRWIVAAAAFFNSAYYFIQNVASQFPRYTHWTLATRMLAPMFTVNGNPIAGGTLLRTLLFLSIVYAIIRYAIDNSIRQSVLEQEFKNARELQQVLVPETLPTVPGFTLTSAYRPAQEVGGDFFQVLPLEGAEADSTLIVLGDVSGKGLKAAMTVSLIVGAIRTLVETSADPVDILAGMNRRLSGRLQGGFTTCIAIRLRSDGHCTVASAGHPPPYLNHRELHLPGALPLGLVPEPGYQATELQLQEGDRFALYTDGLLEARGSNGEIFSFQRLEALFATNPSAVQATDAAVDFGQDDDITVLTLVRLPYGQESTSVLTVPALAPV
jgi:hypothetical protein